MSALKRALAPYLHIILSAYCIRYELTAHLTVTLPAQFNDFSCYL